MALKSNLPSSSNSNGQFSFRLNKEISGSLGFSFIINEFLALSLVFLIVLLSIS